MATLLYDGVSAAQAAGTRETATLDAGPEALREWLLQLRQNHSKTRVGLCREQLASHLIGFLEFCAWTALHPINFFSWISKR